MRAQNRRHMRRRLLGYLCVPCTVLLLTLCSSPAAAAACPNEAIRVDQGTAGLALPDCRAFELVSPGSTPFMTSDGIVLASRASTTGDGLAYFTRYPSSEAERSGFWYLTTRTGSGWSVEDVSPQDSPTGTSTRLCESGFEFSPDLSQGIFSDGWDPGEAIVNPDPKGYCSESEEALAPGAPEGHANLYLSEGTGSYRLINETPEGVVPANAFVRAYTPDFKHILFEEAAPLIEGAPPGKTALYEWSEGTLHLVSVLPNGEPVSGGLADRRAGIGPQVVLPINLALIAHAVSDNGERVLFEANGSLYLRKNATQAPTATGACNPAEATKACTVQVDLKQGGVGTSGGGVFWAASADGSRVLFADESKLTADSKAAAGKPDLYEYTVANGLLKDRSLTSSVEAPAPNVRGFSGISEDGSRLYFVARGVLAGAGENGVGEMAQPFSPNLYLLDGKEIRFIATLDSSGDTNSWGEDGSGEGVMQAAASPSGRYLLFGSVLSLTGFDNSVDVPFKCKGKVVTEIVEKEEVFKEALCAEIFLYDAQENQIECVSCGSDAAAPAGDTRVQSSYVFSERNGAPGYLPRQVFDDGRVFFTTQNSLVPRDVNGARDVYQYLDGQLSLISSGTATGDSAFFDADPSGSNLFFVTSQALVSSDTDNGISIYDARAGGGFSEPPPQPPCEGEGCRGQAPSAATAGALGSLGFAGPEEGPKHPRQPRCKRGFIKRHGACRKRGKPRHSKQGRHRSPKRRSAQ